MASVSLMDSIKDIFIGGVFTEELREKDNGGPECVASITLKFRLTVSLVAIIFYYFIFIFTLKKLKNDILTDTKPVKTPQILDKVLGSFSVAVFILQCIYKINSRQLIFIMNPCHMVGLIQAYLLLSPNKLTQRTIYTVVMNTLFSPWIALVFPMTIGLPGLYEVPMFWVEHILCAIVNPLALSLSHRYYTKSTISVRNHVFAHVMFGFYQRLVLFPLSLVTHANMNFTLCSSENDPFEPFLGKWYLVASELYIFIGGEIFHRIVKTLLDITKKVEGLVFRHSHNVDGEKRD